MWYEIIPSFSIIAIAFGIPPFVSYHMHKLVVGNAFLRDLGTPMQRRFYQRDNRLTNDPYVANGLEVIPDEE